MLVLTNQASHGHGSRVVVDRGVQKHETTCTFYLDGAEKLENSQSIALCVASGFYTVNEPAPESAQSLTSS